jgi:hypothetical protein
MLSRFVHRINFWWSCIAQLSRLVLGGLGLLGMLTLIRDEFLPSLSSYHVFSLLPDWNWQTWLVVALASITIAVLEGAYAQLNSSKAMGSGILLPSSFNKVSPQRHSAFGRWILPVIIVLIVIVLWVGIHATPQPSFEFPKIPRPTVPIVPVEQWPSPQPHKTRTIPKPEMHPSALADIRIATQKQIALRNPGQGDRRSGKKAIRIPG